ncbi:lipoprotein [Spiroplasma cantharicola]|uniref:Lipoprotein n=1 Tax=Spiroplasma cantharicola TaxID=362837 RepID=A0A0M4JII6_9MOLU|nr:lipoprotein [Spiroplasma cantharicola]ALD66429.1 hypothetical protein SCANT_v1c05230 [Spiroplasma cantharicola]
MKKLLTILTGLSIIVTPATQIVSCKITTDNTFRSFKDIEKYWGTKTHNTIIFNSEQAKSDDDKLKYINTEIKKIISNNFINQEEVNKALGNKPDNTTVKDETELIKFEFYKSNLGFLIGNEEKLITFLTDSFQNDKSKPVEVYFKYKDPNNKENPDKLNDKYLDLKFTNIPELKKGVYKDSNSIFGNINKTIQIEKYFFNDLSDVVKQNDTKSLDSAFFKKNKKSTLKFIKGIFKAIKESSENNIDLSNTLQWVEMENPHINDEKNPKYEWKVLSPEEQFYRELLNTSADEESLLEGFGELIKELKNENSSGLKKLTWLGLTDNVFILKQ